MTQIEQREIGALTQRFVDFLGMYQEDRKINQETHDTVITLQAKQNTTDVTVAKNCADIEELKLQPGKKQISTQTAVRVAIITGIAGLVFGAISKLF